MATELRQEAVGGSGADGARKNVAACETPLEHALPELGALRKNGQLRTDRRRRHGLPSAIGSRIMVVSTPRLANILRV